MAQPWLGELEDEQVRFALEAQRRETRLLQERVIQTEAKASRLLTPFVALLTGAVALVALQLSAVDNRDGLSAVLAWIGAVVGGLGSSWLLAGLTRALDSDTRMGRGTSSTTEQEIRDPMKALVNEVRAAQAARFIQQKKAERILFARAAISRSLVLLVIAAFCAALSLLAAKNPGRAPESPAPVGPTMSPAKGPTATAAVTATVVPKVTTPTTTMAPVAVPPSAATTTANVTSSPTR